MTRTHDTLETTRPRPRRRLRVLAGLAGLAVLTATGCSTATEGSGSVDGDTLTYWSMWKEGEPQQKVLAASIEQFTEETGIEVDVQWQGRDVLKKLLPTLTSGDVPDLVDQEAGPMQSAVVSLDQARDLSDAYDEPIPGEEGETIGSVVPERYRPLMTSGDTLFMVPYEVISSAFWFDAAAMPQVAEQPPATWEDFTRVLAQQKSAGKAPLAIDGDISFYNSYYTVYGLLRELGAGNVNKLVADKSGKAWDDPRVLDVARKVESLVADGDFIDGYDGSKYPAVQQKWATGAAAFYYAGTWIPSETGSYQGDGFEISSFQFPSLGGEGDGSVETGMLGFAVPTKAKNYDEAKQLMAFVLAKDNLAGIAEDAENLTPRTDIPAPESLATVQEALEAAPTVHRPYDGIDADFPNYTPQVFEPVNNKLLFGQIDAEEWVSQLKSSTIRYWEQNG